MGSLGVRTAVMSSLGINALGFAKNRPIQRLHMLGSLLRYAMQRPSHQARETMNVAQMVKKWVKAVVGLCQAHDKDAYDAEDAKADELLTPLLAAPVKQVREFYHKLEAKLRADPGVPFLVWTAFTAWGEVMVKNAPDEGVKKLKNKLAGEIADLVELDIRDQIGAAIARALRWRDPEQLEQVKEQLEKGAKPKLTGRESCLFLSVGNGKKKVEVML